MALCEHCGGDPKSGRHPYHGINCPMYDGDLPVDDERVAELEEQVRELKLELTDTRRSLSWAISCISAIGVRLGMAQELKLP
jgi:hypothetical protein